MKKKTPMFVKIDEYKEILDIVNVMKKKIFDSKELLNKINDLKAEEDNELEKWFNQIEEIEKRIIYVDENLFEPKEM